MTLQHTLNEILLDPSADSGAWREAIQEAADELRRHGADRHALDVGDPFPDFLLPDAHGRLVGLEEILAAGPMVLTFFRGPWCNFCTAAVDAIIRFTPPILAEGASAVLVTPETQGRSLRPGYLPPEGAHMLADVDHGLAFSCGVACKVPASMRGLLARQGIDLTERQGSAGGFLPIPATFVVDRSGIVRWRFVDVDFTRRAEPEEILRALRALPAPPPP